MRSGIFLGAVLVEILTAHERVRSFFAPTSAKTRWPEMSDTIVMPARAMFNAGTNERFGYKLLILAKNGRLRHGTRMAREID